MPWPWISRGASRRLIRSPTNFGITAIAFSLPICASALARSRLRCRLARTHLVGRILDRLDDVLVAGASAEVAFQRVTNLGLGRIGVVSQQVNRGHDHPRRAVSALQTV